MIYEKQYIGSQQHWEDSINEDYDRQEQYAKDMEKEMHPQQEEPYPIDFYIHEIKQQSEYITSLLSENKRLKEALGEIVKYIEDTGGQYVSQIESIAKQALKTEIK